MNKTKTLGIVLTLFLILIQVTIIPVFAKPSPKKVHNGSMGSSSYIIIPDEMTMMIEAINIERSPYGPYDFIMVYKFDDDGTLVNMNGYIDNDDDNLLEEFDNMMPYMPIDKVDDEDLEIWRKGKKVFVQTTDDLLHPVDLLPINFYMEFEGYGGAETGTESYNQDGWTWEIRLTSFDAFVYIPMYEYSGEGEVATRMCMTITPPSP